MSIRIEVLEAVKTLASRATPVDQMSGRIAVEITVHGLGLREAIEIAKLDNDCAAPRINTTSFDYYCVTVDDIDGHALGLNLFCSEPTPFGPAEPYVPDPRD